MTVDSQLRNLLASGGEFSTIVEDLNVRHVIISPNGEWTFLKLGRNREGGESLSQGWLEELAGLVPHGQVLRYREWAIRSFEGVGGTSFLVERLPSAVVDRLPQKVVNALKRQIRRDGNGLLVGEPGASKAGILLWLAMQIPDEHVLYVSENPPNELPGAHILHVFPPDTPHQRRNLERLARLNQTVVWDRVASPRDVHTLFGFSGARRRWFSLDASSIRSSLRTLAGYMYQGVDARFDTMVALRASVIGRPEVLNFLMRSDDGAWEEVYQTEGSALEFVRSFTDEGWDGLGGLGQRSDVEEVQEAHHDEMSAGAVIDEIEVGHEQGLGEESSMAGIRKRPGQMTQDFENPLTIPVDAAPEHLEASDEDVTRIRSSGEIDLQDFVHQRNRPGNLPEETRQYKDTEAARNVVEEVDLLGDLLQEDEPPEAVNLEDLRITRAEDVSDETLEAITSASDEEEMPDGDTSSVHYQQIPQQALQPEPPEPPDDDLDSLMNIDFPIDEAFEDWDQDSYADDDDYSDVYDDIELEELSGMISAAELEQTSVANADELSFAMTKERDVPQQDTSPTRTASAELAAAIAAVENDQNEEDQTTEMTVDRLMNIRRKLGDD